MVGSPAETLDLVGIDVDAGDIVADVGEADALDESDVAGADDGDAGHVGPLETV